MNSATAMPKSYERLGLFMEQRGLKQKKVAEKAGISEFKMSRILNGQQPLTVDDLESIASAMEANPLEILATRKND